MKNTPEKADKGSASPARILLGEDDAELRALVAMKLRSAGFEVVEAPDGSALLGRLADGIQPDGTIEHFDLILSDIHMPYFSALDVMIGARRCIATTPIVLITAFGDPKLHERALRLGATAVLDKPIRLDDLCLTICQILTQQGADEPYCQEAVRTARALAKQP